MPAPAPAAPTPRRVPWRCGARGGSPPVARRAPADAGSLSLEAAMALPVVALCALALLQLVGVARDVLLAEDLARIGARVAATDPSDTAVVDAVRDAAGPGVETRVTVTPPLRRHGDTITVEVALTRPDRPFDVQLTGRAATHGEPVLDTGGLP